MRPYLHVVLVLGLAFGLVACDALTSNETLSQVTSPDDEALPDSVQERYEEDAAQLAMRFVQEHNPDTEAVELPDERVQLFYNALVHVYNAEDIAARDEIVGIHTFPRYSTHRALVAVDSTVGWTQEWRAGNRLTGQTEVDALVEEYDLSVEYKAWSSQHTAVLHSEAPINTHALSRRFEAVDGVVYAEPDGGAGDGNDIEAVVEKAAVVLTYSRGWGDCPSGCINHAYWTFRVEEDGTVRFVEETS